MFPQAYSLNKAHKENNRRAFSLPFRPNDYSSEGFNDWAFMTTHSWDEDPRGEWTLEVENVAANERDHGNPHSSPLIVQSGQITSKPHLWHY